MSDSGGMDASDSQHENDEHENKEQGEDDGECGGTPVPPAVWIVDYDGDGGYSVTVRSADGSRNAKIRFDHTHESWLSATNPEFAASSEATVCAYPGDTIVFTPAFALLHSLRMKSAIQHVLARSPIRMPRRKACPFPMTPTEDGIGIVKGGVHSDQQSAFTNALCVNGFHLGLNGCNCMGAQRRWAWTAPERESPPGDGAHDN